MTKLLTRTTFLRTKVDLFESLHTKVNERRKILEDRQSKLEKTREKLVKNSGVVLGSVNQQGSK